MIRSLLLALTGLILASCGNGDESQGPSAPLEGRYVGQEIWISYGPPKPGESVQRLGLSQADALALATKLHRRVLDGEDIGALALEFSNAPGGAAKGFSGLLPVDAAQPSARDRAIASVDIGSVTPVVEWFEGYWFARRVSIETGAELEKLFFREQALRARFRVIALLYVGAWIADANVRDQVKRTRAEAVARADSLLRQIQSGAAFEELARRVSEDGPSAERGGLAMESSPDGSSTEWIRRQSRWFPRSVLEAVFTGPIGEVYPEIIVSPRGVFLVKIEGRKDMRDR